MGSNHRGEVRVERRVSTLRARVEVRDQRRKWLEIGGRDRMDGQAVGVEIGVGLG